MYSRRARIGIITPLGETVEHAFNKFAPDGVAFVTTGLNFPGPTPEGLIFLSDQVEETAKKYAKGHFDVILFGCTSGSCIGGFGFGNGDKEPISNKMYYYEIVKPKEYIISISGSKDTKEEYYKILSMRNKYLGDHIIPETYPGESKDIAIKWVLDQDEIKELEIYERAKLLFIDRYKDGKDKIQEIDNSSSKHPLN